MKKQAGFSSGGKARRPKRKGSTAGKVFLAFMTFCNLLLSLLLAVQRRQEVLHAVEEDDGTVKLLLTAKRETKN